MDDQVVLWVQRDADGLERRCAVALIDEGDFELRLWRGLAGNARGKEEASR
jgi:hypothetical protein